jgi:hypothetical protein
MDDSVVVGVSQRQLLTLNQSNRRYKMRALAISEVSSVAGGYYDEYGNEVYVNPATVDFLLLVDNGMDGRGGTGRGQLSGNANVNLNGSSTSTTSNSTSGAVTTTNSNSTTNCNTSSSTANIFGGLISITTTTTTCPGGSTTPPKP